MFQSLSPIQFNGVSPHFVKFTETSLGFVKLRKTLVRRRGRRSEPAAAVKQR